MTVTLRLAGPDDELFLFELYCSTRTAELAAWGLDETQQKTFLELQFTARQRHYELAYEGADHKIVLRDDHPAGRLLVFSSDHEYVLVDIALLPEQRGSGIGTALIQELLDKAKGAGKAVSLHVEKHNRARQLYERLGFDIIGDTGVYFKMEWRPGRG
jgi:ribosomal protein S18 acetylase RimI-like enzyme